jgi:hypothetical protein
MALLFDRASYKFSKKIAPVRFFKIAEAIRNSLKNYYTIFLGSTQAVNCTSVSNPNSLDV